MMSLLIIDISLWFWRIVLSSVMVPLVAFPEVSVELHKRWEVDEPLSAPESVVYDPFRSCFYVSNFNDKAGFRKKTDLEKDEYITKISVAGQVVSQKWIDGLIGPTGLAVQHDTLYVIERGFLTKINIEDQTIVERIPIPEAEFLNDIAIADNGDVFLTDTKREGAIYRIKNGRSELWLCDETLNFSNGIFLKGDQLLVGNRGVKNFVSIGLNDKAIQLLASNIAEGIDGIGVYSDQYLVSWRSKIFSIDRNGRWKVVLDTSDTGEWNCNFECVEDEGIIVIPSLMTNKLIAYEIVLKG